MTTVSDLKFGLSDVIRLARIGGQLSERDQAQQDAIAKACRRFPSLPGAILLPLNAPVSVPQTRAMTTTGGGSGAVGSIGVSLPFAEALRQRSLLGRLGATVISDLKAEARVCIPRFIEGSSVEWLGEFEEAGGSYPFLGGDLIGPCRAHAYVDITRTLAGNSDAVEQCSQDLISALASALDASIISGGGNAFNEPLGILNRDDLDVIPLGTNGGEINHNAVQVAVASLMGKGIEQGELAWITSPRSRQAACKTPKIAGHPVYVCEDLTSTMGGVPVWSHTAMPDDLIRGTGTGLGSMLLGNFSKVAIALWGVIDILVNPYSMDSSGVIRVNAYLYGNYGLRSPGSFVAIKDILTTG